MQDVTAIVAEISSASVEQAAGIEEVNKAITMMDGATQENAALVEESAAAAEAMGSRARALKTQIAYFTAGRVAYSQSQLQSQPQAISTPSTPSVVEQEPGPIITPDFSALVSDESDWEEF